MNRSTLLMAGIFASFVFSCFALVLVPQAQLGRLQPHVDKDEEDKVTGVYPVNHVKYGARVYASEGCVYCHSQQVRDPQNGRDIASGWGVRRTVARDYLYDEPVFLGSSRFGPDLANIGAPTWRNEPENDTRRPGKRDAAWHYLHLYKPRAVIFESNMPPYRYLFEKRKIGGQRSANALPADQVNVEDGYEIVPKADAVALVGYLLSLNRGHPLPEAKSDLSPATPAIPGAPATPTAPTAPAPPAPTPAAE
ncbi:MAG: cbb3-type cytochrome c oxidase subunit II [Verrucomicrobiota bacterium]|nr:cbb3-type cytochrome c oxidase subunit II [Verrucomicrobiota bacterium]